jgi:hypothetical protein
MSEQQLSVKIHVTATFDRVQAHLKGAPERGQRYSVSGRNKAAKKPSSSDRENKNADFKSRAMSAAAKNEKD